MNIEQREHLAADHCLHVAYVHAMVTAPDDTEAATAGILMLALELATPDLTPERRAALFIVEQDQQVRTP